MLGCQIHDHTYADHPQPGLALSAAFTIRAAARGKDLFAAGDRGQSSESARSLIHRKIAFSSQILTAGPFLGMP